MLIHVQFGHAEECFEADIASERLLGVCLGPCAEALDVPGDALGCCLDAPLDFPPLQQALVPGDRVTIALDAELQQPEALVLPIVTRLLAAGVAAKNIVLLSPSGGTGKDNGDPRNGLPAELADAVVWARSEPTRRASLSYLGNTAGGQRIYLDHRLVEADVVLPVGCMRWDSLLGYRGPSSVLYPSLSDEATLRRLRKLAVSAGAVGTLAAGHDVMETPAQQIQQETDEIAWLLGVHFAVGVVTATNGTPGHVLAGDSRSVFETGKQLVAETWQFMLPRRCDVVVAGISGQSSQPAMTRMAAALEAAQRVVEPGGTIVLLTGVDGEIGPGMQALAAAADPDDVLAALEEEAPPDAVAAHRVASVVGAHRVYLRSRLPAQLVEDLFIEPIDSLGDVTRLLGEGSIVVLNNADRVATVVEGDERYP